VTVLDIIHAFVSFCFHLKRDIPSTSIHAIISDSPGIIDGVHATWLRKVGKKNGDQTRESRAQYGFV
jgi:hypothetical protein